jgi:hypothetical protein
MNKEWLLLAMGWQNSNEQRDKIMCKITEETNNKCTERKERRDEGNINDNNNNNKCTKKQGRKETSKWRST